MHEHRRLRFDPWVQVDPLEEEMAIHSSILAGRIPIDRGAWQATVQSVAESDMIEQLSRNSTYSESVNYSVMSDSLRPHGL